MPDVMSSRRKQSGFIESRLKLFGRDADVLYIQAVLSHFGTEDDKSPMTVRRYVTTLIPFGEESVFTVLDVVTKSSFESPNEGQTLLR